MNNQGLSASGTVSVFLSIVVLVAIALPIISRRLDAQNIDVARHRAEEFSMRVTSLEKLSPPNQAVNSDRIPASAGAAQNSGNGGADVDPWGRPYKYTFIKNQLGQPIYVAVWSLGPNAKSDTNENDLSMESSGALHATFVGDDVGFIRAIR